MLVLLLLLSTGIGISEKGWVECEVVATTITCDGDDVLTRDHIRHSGTYSLYTAAKLKEGITGIGSKAFVGCVNLVQIELPTTVVEFQTQCFQQCAFVTFHIPASVITMASSCWNNCTSLKTFTIDANHPSYTVTDGFLMKKNENNNYDLFCVGAGFGRAEGERTVSLPSCEKILSSSMTWNACEMLIIHDDTYEVNSMAFHHADYLTTIKLGKGLAKWNYAVLSRCEAITTFDLNGNTNFYSTDEAFGKLNSKSEPHSILWIADTVTELIIPQTVTVIGHTAFQYRRNLVNITVEEGNPYLSTADNNQLLLDKGTDSTVFNRVRSCVGGARSVTVPAGVTELYTWCLMGCNLLTEVTLSSDMRVFYPEPFRECMNLTTIDFGGCNAYDSNGEGILVGQLAYNCPLLATISNWPSNDFSIGDTAFRGCGFTSLSLPENCLGTVSGSFAACSELESVTIPSRMTFLGFESFAECTKLKTVTFTAVSTLKTLAAMAFAECDSLTTITLPRSITSLDENPFVGCLSLTSINFDGDNEFYMSDGTSVYQKSGTNQYYTFVICPAGLTAVTLNPETVVIGMHAFYRCAKLLDVVMNDQVTMIQRSAFAECNALEFIRLSTTITTIGSGAFNGCSRLKSIIYCSSNNQITYSGDPFPTDPKIYLSQSFVLEETGECDFCGHTCYPVLDEFCNIPTEAFTGPLVHKQATRASQIATLSAEVFFYCFSCD